MKIISGFLKGRTLGGYKIDGTRPTMDRVKESLFAMLQNDIEDSIVLDLFAGSGSLGFEAISNGSKKVYFVDHNRKCILEIQKNIERFSISSSCDTLCSDYKDALRNFAAKRLQFHLVFLDPPYAEKMIPDVISYLLSHDMLQEGAKIICEISNLSLKKEYKELSIWKEKKYSDKYIVIYEKN